ncbi:MAG: prepilin-type N-terminal cleavage/methylation domain-containing protein [Candidatus Paceibacteria bacterium]|jgi:prepilin-type N-terminal cleavage/methylation domain-containing protein
MKNKKGFTLIELLVVIAIIGILSSVVLASLNSARGKGEVANTKSQLAQMRVQAEIFYDDNEDYDELCDSLGFPGDGLFVNLPTASCSDSVTSWAAHSPVDVGNWCVDSSGSSSNQDIDGAGIAVDPYVCS